MQPEIAAQSLKVGIATNDRMLRLLLRDARAAGLALSFERAEPSQIFWRALKLGEFDITEMSLAAHAILTSRGENPFIGLPVFTSRMFRHGSLFVSEASGITSPVQLQDRRVGVPEYQMTAAVWMRGILHDQYGVAPDSISWLTGGVNKPGREERIELRVPPQYQIENIGPEDTLDALLLDGAIDAIMSPEIPNGFKRTNGRVRRLFADTRATEEAYFRATSIFPIMHLLVLRREIYEANPQTIVSLYQAFQDAKEHALDQLYNGDALYVMLPWLVDEMERTFELMGRDFWPYGVSRNDRVLRTFIGYLHRQGMLEQPVEVAELFASKLHHT